MPEMKTLNGYEIVDAKAREDISKISIPTVPTKTSQLTNDSGFITSIPSTYVTETELTNKGYQTAAQVNTLINNALGVIENGSY